MEQRVQSYSEFSFRFPSAGGLRRKDSSFLLSNDPIKKVSGSCSSSSPSPGSSCREYFLFSPPTSLRFFLNHPSTVVAAPFDQVGSEEEEDYSWEFFCCSPVEYRMQPRLFLQVHMWAQHSLIFERCFISILNERFRGGLTSSSRAKISSFAVKRRKTSGGGGGPFAF